MSRSGNDSVWIGAAPHRPTGTGTRYRGTISRRCSSVLSQRLCDPLAKRLSGLDADRQIAGLVLISDAISSEDYDSALAYLEDESFGFNTLLKGLLTGWVKAGQGDMAAAQDSLNGLGQDSGFGPLAHIQVLLQLDRRDDAVAVIDEAGGGSDPELAELKARIEAGESIQFDAVTSAKDGAAEVCGCFAAFC